ncbi:DUF2330 domain-containing protein [Tsukamurella pseudospumae]|uniref:DUF2330 domain-containing protein n=1 Tax=Tsukamurella pseudospumae TaxID=239498 RepID=A0A138AXC1_9ACTN|nr:DUF2330 domain-containing protein [Tsukamurella pseudospumae]KXP15108.1 hypothetical protein AXK60_04405 [Tsukamurella pseudospumae]
MAQYSTSSWSRLCRSALVALLAATSLVSAPTASACACGAPAMPDGVDATATQEIALVSGDGRTETIEMRLALQSAGDRGALVVPTPAPATVSGGTAETFTELGWITKPRVDTRRRLFGFPNLIPLMGAGNPGAPEVLGRVRIGPIEAVTLRGGDAPGLQRWLSDNGFALRAEVAATLTGYVADGWSFVALRLVGDDLRGGLKPVRLTFPSTELVYPMRMSRAARQSQRVTVYALGHHRVERTDADRGRQDTTLEFAGRIGAATHDPRLTELSAGVGDYLTRITTEAAPESITTDFRFGRAATDEPYQRVDVEYVADGRTALTTMLTAVGALAGFAFLVGGAAVIDRRRRARG